MDCLDQVRNEYLIIRGEKGQKQIKSLFGAFFKVKNHCSVYLYQGALADIALAVLWHMEHFGVL